VVVYFLLAVVVAVLRVHCSHRRRDDVALDVALLLLRLLLTGYLRPVDGAEHLVRLLADLVELFCVLLLPLVVQA
jgi:hypothetical protein